jgi:methyl-accepting chemotaxis protein
MDKIVQRNAASAEELAAASEEMNTQAFQIKDFVGRLRSMVDGSKTENV